MDIAVPPQEIVFIQRDAWTGSMAACPGEIHSLYTGHPGSPTLTMAPSRERPTDVGSIFRVE
jgi:hypothetical protein